MHGHGQCTHCGNNIEPCCSGASAQGEASATTGIATGLDPQLFPRLFEQLGGRACTVTEASLLFALTQRLGGDLDEARLVLEAAARLGIVNSAGPGLHRLRMV